MENKIGAKVKRPKHVANADRARKIRCLSCGGWWWTVRMFQSCPACADLEAQVRHRPGVAAAAASGGPGRRRDVTSPGDPQ